MRSRVAAILLAALVIGVSDSLPVSAQDTSGLAGRWTLNRSLSQLPSEIGFGLPVAPGGGSGRDSTGRGGGSSAFPVRPESEDDAGRMRQLTAEVRNPSAHLTIVESPSAVTITDDRGASRTFHPDGKEEVLRLDGVPVAATAKWEAGRLVIVYKVEEGRQLRYTYSGNVNPAQLVVDVKFIERAGGDSARRIYEPTSATEPTPSPAGATGPPPPRAAAPPSAAPDRLAPPIGAQQPDAELKGLMKLGVVVEDLSPQAAACGLTQGAIETAVSKSLTDAGLTVRRNSDEDTYVYVNVITTSLTSGVCVSRYDAFLYTNTTATLSYQTAPQLVQVSLLHKGGIAGGAPAAHAEGVLRGVTQYVDQFAARIRNANK